ncbi:MAG: hypothetical protein QM696_00405 [Steroidobacteraceae bacterium]
MSGRISTRSMLAVALLPGLAACSDPPARPIAYRGEYHYDAGGGHLVQAGVEARICIRDADMTPAIQPEFVATGGRSEVVVRGLLSARGRYGPEGVCNYELTRSELLGVGKRMER